MTNPTTMTIQEEFSNIVKTENVHTLIPFIKKLSKEDKKSIATWLKKEHKNYFEYVEVTLDDGRKTWKTKGSPSQLKIFYMAGYCCYDFKTFRSKIGRFDKNEIDIIGEFYYPNWFSDYINSYASSGWFPWQISYHWLMEKVKVGVLKPTNELLVATIGQSVFQRVEYKKRISWKFTPERLEVYEETLRNHFWLLFQYETNIHSQRQWIRVEDEKDKDMNWLEVIANLCEKEKLPRERVLKEALIATTRDFNRNLINWYIDLFKKLSPNVEELLSLQTDLFHPFHSAQSKPKNEILKLCKTIASESAFDDQGFIENGPILLASETKSVVNSTLMILEKIAKKDEELGREIAVLACHAFLQNDENIQSRAAKIILKYGDSEQEELKTEINMYQEGLVFSVKEMLEDYLEVMEYVDCLLYTSPSPRDQRGSRMPSSA